MNKTIEIKVKSELYGVTDCVIDIDSFLSGRRTFPCGDGCDYKLTDKDVLFVNKVINPIK